MSRGTRWRIGNGEKVRMWVDKWLPDTPSFKPFIHVCVLEGEKKVCELINRDLNTWKKGLVQACFVPLEANQILSIPFSMRKPEYKIIWHHEKDSEYSVRYAYHFLQQLKMSKSLGPSNTPHNMLWKLI